MKVVNTPAIACRHCQHYESEGRRGGHCQQLGTLVRGSWEACPLMMLSFSLAQKSPEEAIAQQKQSQVSYPIEVVSSQRLVKNQLLKRNSSGSEVLHQREFRV